MTIATAAKITFDIALIALLLTGYIHEEQVAEFERKAWKAICRKINKRIAAYERRKRHGQNVSRPQAR